MLLLATEGGASLGSGAVAARLRYRGLRLPPWCGLPMTTPALTALDGAHKRIFVSVLAG